MKKIIYLIIALILLPIGANADCDGIGYVFTSMFWNHDWKTEFKAVCKNDEKDIKLVVNKIYRSSPIEILNDGFELTLTNTTTREELKNFNYDGYDESDFRDSLSATFNGTKDAVVKYINANNAEVTLRLSCEIKVRGVESCGGTWDADKLPNVRLGVY